MQSASVTETTAKSTSTGTMDVPDDGETAQRPASPRTVMKAIVASCAQASGLGRQAAVQMADTAFSSLYGPNPQFELRRVPDACLTAPQAPSLPMPPPPRLDNSRDEIQRRGEFNDVAVVFQALDDAGNAVVAQLPRTVLAYHNRYFSGLFRSGYMDARQNPIVLPVDDPALAAKAVEYMLSQRATLPLTTAREAIALFKLAQYWGSDQILLNVCFNALPALIKSPSWAELFQTGDMDESSERTWLLTLIDAACMHNKDALLHIPVNGLSVGAIRIIYALDDLPLSERVIYKALLKWASSHGTETQTPIDVLRANDLLQLVRFEHMDEAGFKDEVVKARVLSQQETTEIAAARVLAMQSDYPYPVTLLGRPVTTRRTDRSTGRNSVFYSSRTDGWH